MGMQRLHQGLAPLTVGLTQLAHMGGVMPAIHEGRHGRLQQLITIAVEVSTRCGEQLGQRRGQHHEAQPDARKHGLAEAAQINHAVAFARIGIHPLQRRHRRAVVAKLAVVIVFQQQGAMRAGISQPGLATCQ